MESVVLALLACCLLPFASAQSNSESDNVADSIYGTSSTTTSTPTSTTSNTPISSSDRDINSDRDTDMGGLVHYYFIFLALIVILAASGAFFMYRRKRKAAFMYHHGQTGALQQDVGAWDPARARRRYWQGTWRSPDEHNATHRDEGLNEHGEAPPPYMPKGQQQDEEAGLPMRTNGSESAAPAVPMQTLSREQAGLKPPGYECTVNGHDGERTGAATSSSTTSGAQQIGGAAAGSQHRQ